jgi:predicted lipoprotein with Yx(FWY)xxD motif
MIVTTRIRRTMYTLVAGAAVIGALAGCSDAATTGVAPAAQSEHAGHGTGSHTMPDGQAMADMDMSDMSASDMSGMDGMDHMDMPGMDGGLALWATQKSGGKVMVIDGDGRPFYRSNADGAAPPRPTCAGPCATGWEPVTVAAGETPDLLGVQRSAVGTVRRADGTTQLTLGGAPLYRHAGPAPAQPDPRQFTAQGWYVVTPRGDRVAS